MSVFQYQGYSNPYGPSIAEALAHQADPQAAAALRTGDIQAQALERQSALRGQLFTQLGAIPGQIQASQDAAQQRAARQQQLQIGAQTLQENQLTLADRQAQRDADMQLGKLFASAPRGSDGTVDMRGFLGTVPPELTKYAEKWVQQGNAMNESWIADDTRRRGQMQQSAQALLAAGAPFQATLGVIETARRDRVLTDEQAAQYKNDAIEDPAGPAGVLKRLTGPPKLQFIGADQRGIDPTGRVVVPALGKPGEGDYTINGIRFHADGTQVGPAVPLQAPARTPEQIALDQARVDEIRGKLAGTIPISLEERAKLNLELTKIKAQQTDVTDLTPAGLDAAALNYAKTGQLPPLGMGDKATRKQIINRAADMMPGLDVASAKADYGANTQSLQALQKQRDAIGAFDQTAQKNIDLFLTQAGKVVDTGSPLANSLMRQVSGKMLGSTDQAAYEAARQVAITEIAKITQGGGIAGVLSDSARHEISAFNPESATLAQTVAVMRLLKQDMANRTSALDDAIGGIKSRIGKGAPGAAGGGGVTKDPLGLF